FLDSNLAGIKPSARGEAGRPSRAAWPPTPVPVYWLPQRLRDYIIERFGEDSIELYVYLMSIIERHGNRPDNFAQTPHFTTRCDSLRLLASKRHPGEEVNVSIVVPVFNNFIYTLTSLVSLLEHDSHRSYEILIGDDGSTDATLNVFTNAGGCIRLI